MSGIKIAAYYSFKPNDLGLCGPKNRILKNFLNNEKIFDKDLRKILKQFKVAFEYYKLIARCNNIKNPFDEKVVKAYWIGNELLENVSAEKFKTLIAQEFDLPKKAMCIAKHALPHHNTHVEIIGAVYSNIKFTKKLKNLCKITCKKIGDRFCSFHWEHQCMELTREDIKNLKKYGK